MTLSLRSFAASVSQGVASAQGACASLLNLGVGTPGRALIESVAGTGLWLQFIGIQVLARTRLATSTGTDADSFVNDFGMTRLPGVAATGSVTMTSFTPAGSSAVIIPGALVRTVAGVSYAVTQDSSLSTWSASQGGYVRPAGTASITVPVQAVVAGGAGNASVGAICLLGSSISGIDTVTNPAALTNGSDGETDAALRARFPAWLAAKATASVSAVQTSVSGVQANITQALMDGEDPSGAARAGYFTVAVDDGSGDPADSLLTSVYEAVESVRACGVGFAVQRPTDVTADVAMTVTVPYGVNISAVQIAIGNAISADITAQGVGAGYAYSRLSYVAFSNAGAAVTSITGVLLNGGQADIPANSTAVVRPGAISITVQVAR